MDFYLLYNLQADVLPPLLNQDPNLKLHSLVNFDSSPKKKKSFRKAVSMLFLGGLVSCQFHLMIKKKKSQDFNLGEELFKKSQDLNLSEELFKSSG